MDETNAEIEKLKRVIELADLNVASSEEVAELFLSLVSIIKDVKDELTYSDRGLKKELDASVKDTIVRLNITEEKLKEKIQSLQDDKQGDFKEEMQKRVDEVYDALNALPKQDEIVSEAVKQTKDLIKRQKTEIPKSILDDLKSLKEAVKKIPDIQRMASHNGGGGKGSSPFTYKNGTVVGRAKNFNFIEGSGTTININQTDDRHNVTITSGGSSLSAGNGIVLDGNEVNFAQSSNYLAGFLFYPDSTTTVAQTLKLNWDEANAILFLNAPLGVTGGLITGTNGEYLGAVRTDGSASFTTLGVSGITSFNYNDYTWPAPGSVTNGGLLTYGNLPIAGSLSWTSTLVYEVGSLRITEDQPSLWLKNNQGSANKKNYVIASGDDVLKFTWYNDAENDALILGSFSSTGDFTAVGSLNIGDNSVPAGNNFALGQGNSIESGSEASVVMGLGNTLNGDHSLVMGSGNTVTGDNLLVIGTGMTVTADDTLIVGPGITLDGITSNAEIVGRVTLGSITMNTATASTVAVWDGVNSLESLANGSGVLKNNGSGTLTWGTVSYSQIQNISATQRVLGRNTAGSGVTEEVTGTQVLDWIGSTRGSVLYRGSSAWSALTPGTSGYVLTSNGAGADPSYQVIPAGGLATTGSAYAIVGGSATATTNGTNLLSAYTTAKSATPHGAALSASNRYTIYLLPGVFDLGSSTLTLDTLYIDVVGISTNSGAMVYTANYSLGDTIIKSSGTVVNINNTADSGSHNITLANVCVQTTTASSSDYCISTTQNQIGAKWQCINVLFNHGGSANPARAMPSDKNLAGMWIDVRCWHPRCFGDALFSSITLLGTFIRCKGGSACFGNVANPGGTVPTLSGTFIDCEGDSGSFGSTTTAAGAVLSGTFIRCIGGMNWGGGGGGSSLGGSGATMSGYFQDCLAYSGSGNSFGGGTMSGVMHRCGGSTGPVTPSWTSVTGVIKDCNFTGWNGAYPMNTADSSAISNTSAETNFSTTKTIAVSDWKVGRAWTWMAWLKYGTDAITPGTLTFKAKFGSTAIATSAAISLFGSASNQGIMLTGMFTCRTTGSSGTISSQMKVEYNSTVNLLAENVIPSNGTVTINTTTSNTFQISATWSVADTDNTILMENFILIPQEVN